ECVGSLRQPDRFVRSIQVQIDFLDRFIVRRRGSDQDGAVRLGRLRQGQRRRRGFREQLAVLGGRLGSVLVLHVLRISRGVAHEGLDRGEVGGNVGGGEQSVRGADAERVVPVVRPVRGGARDEPVRDGLAGAIGRRQQPAGGTYGHLLEPVR